MALNIVVNGERRNVEDGTPLSDLLKTVGIEPATARGVAVAVNEYLVRKADWEGHRLRDGDRVEIVTARQGG